MAIWQRVLYKMAQKVSITLQDEAATQRFASIVAKYIRSGVVYLIGDLGAGKTTLTRAWLQSLGHQGNVKSPTYTLVEPYEINGQPIYHFDLYRLQDPFELELIGIRDYLQQENALLLVEWPQKGEPIVPSANFILELHTQSDGITRTLTLTNLQNTEAWSALEMNLNEQFT